MTTPEPPIASRPPGRLPFGTARVFLSLALGTLAVAAVAKPPLDDDARAVVILVVAAVAGLSARSSLLLLSARRGFLVVDAGAPQHRLLFVSGPAALLGVVLAVPLYFLGDAHPRFEVLLAGLFGAAGGVILALADRKPKGPRATSLFAWVVVDTALPAGVVAACAGVCIAFLRLHAKDVVTAGELARHLGATTFFYALLLGLGGFFKTYGEQTAGLVVVAKSDHRVPGPVVVGGTLGVLLLVVVSRFVPALPLLDVLVIKAAAGVVVGGGLSLLGAIQGARAASLGLRGRRAISP